MASCTGKTSNKQDIEQALTSKVDAAGFPVPVESMAESNYTCFIVFSFCGMLAFLSFNDQKGYEAVFLALTCVCWVLNFAALFNSSDANNHPPEDSALGVDASKRSQDADTRRNGPTRMERVATNQMENLPMALLVIWAAYNAGVDKETLAILMSVFVGLRICFVAAYLAKLSPLRTIIWMLSQVSVIVVAVYGNMAACTKYSDLTVGDHWIAPVPMVCTTLLWFLNLYFLMTSVDPNNHPAEDTALGVNEENKAAAKACRKSGPTRVDRIAVNQLEQFALALIVMWAAQSVGASKMHMAVIFIVYTSLRILYIGAYLFGLARGRSFFWMGGQFTVVAAMVVGCMAAGSDYKKLTPMLATSVLWVLYIFSLVASVDPNNRPAEDFKRGLAALSSEARAAASEARRSGPVRWERIAANSLENLPLGFIVLWAAVSIGADKHSMAILFVMFAGFRVLYMICYLFAVSPGRSLMFLAASATVVVAMVFGFLRTQDVDVIVAQ